MNKHVLTVVEGAGAAGAIVVIQDIASSTEVLAAAGAWGGVVTAVSVVAVTWLKRYATK